MNCVVWFIEADIIPFFRLPNNFTWTYVGPHNITLRWDVRGLGEQFADQIAVTALLDGVLNKNKTVGYKLGEVTLSGLKANSTYEMIVEAIKGGRIIEHYFDEIDTLPEDQPEHEQTASSYTPRIDVFTYRGTDESVVTTTGSASSSAISGIILACMAVMLA
ncbi:45 kDa antigen [Taenia solium]